MTKKLMAANWKMYKTAAQALDVAGELVKLTAPDMSSDREVLVCPPFTALSSVARAFADTPGFHVGAQNFYPAVEGAFTGEIALDMLKESGVSFVLAGHSERRHVLGESNVFVGEKVAHALSNDMRVILCIGEKIEEREAGKLDEVLEKQLETGLSGVTSSVGPEALAIAYEPVWAIGTGKVAGPKEIVDAHGRVRALLERMLPSHGKDIAILYGGSVKPDNATEIISLDNVGGVLVGGASLQAASFSRIVLA